jgi:hypothetical protein
MTKKITLNQVLNVVGGVLFFLGAFCLLVDVFTNNWVALTFGALFFIGGTGLNIYMHVCDLKAAKVAYSAAPDNKIGYENKVTENVAKEQVGGSPDKAIDTKGGSGAQSGKGTQSAKSGANGGTKSGKNK